MTRRSKRPPCPRYQQTYPDTLATVEELRALGLKPGTTEPDALLEYVQKDRMAGVERLHAEFRRLVR